MSLAIRLAERRALPDAVVRWGIRRQLAERLRGEALKHATLSAAQDRLVAELQREPIARSTVRANEQHYEVPAAFFTRMLGPRLKYSCCLWDESTANLAAAEEAMLALTCLRAQLDDGMRVLDLGCGWGSLCLWIAEHYPRSRVTAVSNSRPQGEYIRQQCRERGWTNVEVLTNDMNDFSIERRFDRVLSIEMFEHMRNYDELLRRIGTWLAPGGKLFVHVFCHERFAYPFTSDTADDWMARHFFTDGLMPSVDLLPRFSGSLAHRELWRVNGQHYARTLEAWLVNLDHARQQATRILDRAGGSGSGRLALARWRMFLMACAELFAYRGGEEWFVAHYLFDKSSA